MSISEEEYFNMINNIPNVSKKEQKPIYEYGRDDKGKIQIKTQQNNIVIKDNIEILLQVIDEYIKLSEKLNIEIKMYTILYSDTKKEKYKNQISILKNQLIENNLKIKTLIKMKGDYSGK